MDDHLGYSKYDYQNKETTDSRNGFSKKTVTPSMEPITLDIWKYMSEKGIWTWKAVQMD